MRAESLLQRFRDLSRELGWTEPTTITKLHGDASARTYYRLTRADGGSVVLMVMPEGAASASEEITNFQGQSPEPPFLLMARALREAGLPVPDVLHHSPADRWIVLEDVGESTLFNRVVAADSATRLTWYRRAIDLLVTMQRAMANGDSIAHQRAFDATLLNWEFDHFAEFLLAARGHALPATALAQFTTLTREITDHIVALPYGFTHRDFQSRNLMARNDALILIDFQDALLGPYVYDLVALLRDSYVALTPDDLTTLIDYYATARGEPVAELRDAFHWVTLQRKMKDAGRFVYIDQVKKNPNFLQYIPTTLEYVRHACTAMPRYRPLFELLQPYVPEWQS